MVIAGMVIAVIGSAIYMSSGGYADKTCLLSELWSGKETHEIWEKCAGEIPQGHWYLSKLGYGDAIAMLGIAVSCFAAITGMWGATFAMFREKEIFYAILALIVAVLLTLCALGIISVKH